MFSSFISVRYLADQVHSVIGPGKTRRLADLVAQQMWNRGVRSIDALCADQEFFEFTRYIDDEFGPVGKANRNSH